MFERLASFLLKNPFLNNKIISNLKYYFKFDLHFIVLIASLIFRALFDSAIS